jgi:hypothetical protein
LRNTRNEAGVPSKSDGRKSKPDRKEIQVKSFHFLCRIEPSQGLAPTSTAFFILGRFRLQMWRRRKAVFASGCSSVFVSGSSGLMQQVKGWRHFDRGWRPCETRGRYLPDLSAASRKGAKKGTVASTEQKPGDPRKKDRPIDPMFGKNTPA